jgi:hypothetical protein
VKSRKRRIYISGPITHNPNWKKDFEEAKEKLQKRYPDMVFVCPLDIDFGGYADDWQYCMRKCLSVMFTCDELVALPDTNISVGRSGEAFLAGMYGMFVNGYDMFMRGGGS